MMIDRDNFLVFKNGRKLKKHEKFHTACIKCSKYYQSSLKRERGIESSWHCTACARAARNSKYSLKNFDKNSLVIDKKQFKIFDATGTRGAVKMNFEVGCDSCNTQYRTWLQNEMKKKHPWNCKSCAIKLEWSENCSYIEKHRNSAREMWKRESYREKVRIRPNSPWTCGIRNWYEMKSGKKIYLRSLLEKRFAEYLDSVGETWSYESQYYVLNDGRLYIPDFFIGRIQTWFEVKGRELDNDLEKFELFRVQHSDVKIALMNRNLILRLERGMKLEDCV